VPHETDVLSLCAGDIAPPLEDLEDDERVFWYRTAPILAAAKMLTPADLQTLVDYCRACYWVQATTRRLHTAWKDQPPNMHLIKMLDAQARGWVEKKTSLAGELGLTAIARTKTAFSGQVTNAKARQSKVAELQARARELRRPMPMAEVS
jgi:phage terminase small subunit